MAVHNSFLRYLWLAREGKGSSGDAGCSVPSSGEKMGDVFFFFFPELEIFLSITRALCSPFYMIGLYVQGIYCI